MILDAQAELSQHRGEETRMARPPRAGREANAALDGERWQDI